jgi:hypothetical protein
MEIDEDKDRKIKMMQDDIARNKIKSIDVDTKVSLSIAT